jgi:hypothetical protein
MRVPTASLIVSVLALIVAGIALHLAHRQTRASGSTGDIHSIQHAHDGHIAAEFVRGQSEIAVRISATT